MKRSLLFFVSTLSIITFFTSCNNDKSENIDSNAIQLEIKEADGVQLSKEPHTANITDKRIIVLLGYGFNDEESVAKITEFLDQKYGLAKNGCIIQPLIFPNDFKRGGRSYVSDFSSEIFSDGLDLQGILILGAPENTHMSLARNQDRWAEKVPYPVFALFPQDESLGLESTCDLVLDKGSKSDSSASSDSAAESDDPGEEEILSDSVMDIIPELISDALDYMISGAVAFDKDISIDKHVSQIFKGRKLHHYTDPETGLQSINHFVLN